MKFFNVDLHVSVVEDVATNLAHLGHEVESHLMSGHYWALGKARASRGTGPGADGAVGYKSLNLATWSSMFDDMPALSRVRAWQGECTELDAFDGFIVTHLASMELLYDSFRGRTIVVASTRYEHPFTERPDAWRAFNDLLARGVDAGRLTVVANNRYDAAYFEYFTGLAVPVVSSTCEYVDRLSPRWSPRGVGLLAFGEPTGCRAAQATVPDVAYVRDAFRGAYRHEDVARARGVVWVPYNASIMSFFEHYRLCVPIFVPTGRFLVHLATEGRALSQLSWHGSLLRGSNLPAARGGSLPDPHTREGVEAWMSLYDFYDREEFPHVTYFDSWEDLREKIDVAGGVDLHAISRAMAVQNAVRQARNVGAWRGIVEWVTS